MHTGKTEFAVVLPVRSFNVHFNIAYRTHLYADTVGCSFFIGDKILVSTMYLPDKSMEHESFEQ
jgi:hypothetical protein